MTPHTSVPQDTPSGSTDAPPPRSNRFFGWIRSTALVREPGWIGGVCSGIASRIGIDPLIVRGIFVVVAVLGGPAILLYAIAWLLLPDRFNSIHLERAIRGTIDGPIIAIGALVVLSVLPVTQGFWALGGAFWQTGVGLGHALWTILVIGLLVALVIWIVRRAHASTPGPAAPSAPPTPTLVTPTIVAPEPAAKPARPAADAPTEEFAEWRERQAAWKAERAAFAQQQAATARELSQQRARERQEAYALRQAEGAERVQAWRLANPRVPGSLAAITIGLAIVAGGIAGFVASTVADWHGLSIAAGFGTATIVLGICVIAAGVFGRRNGFIIFLSVVSIVVTVLAAFIPNDRELLGVNATSVAPGSYTQLAGYTTVGGGGDVDLWQGAGSVTVRVAAGATVRVDIVTERSPQIIEQTKLPAGYLPSPDESFHSNSDGTPDYLIDYVTAPSRSADGEFHYSRTYGPGTTADQVVHIWQGAGSIDIYDYNQKATNQ